MKRIALLCLALSLALAPRAARAAAPTLAYYPQNPAYLQSRGEPVVLVGDYTWGTFSDAAYDYKAMFDALRADHLNLARVWLFWGSQTGFDAPKPTGTYRRVNVMPYLRTGPGLALDGKPKYDLNRPNPAFYQRLRAVCQAARDRGIHLQLILFDAWMIKVPELWRLHAYNGANNVNGVNGDPRRTGKGNDPGHGFCSMGNPTVVKYQHAYVRRVLEAANGFDNVLFEVANENYYSPEWEEQMAEFIRQVEARMPRQHLVIPRDIPNHDFGGIKTWDRDKLQAAIAAARQLARPLIFDTDGIEYPEDKTVRRAAWTALTCGANVDYLDDSLQPGGDSRGDFRGTRRTALRKQLGLLAVAAERAKLSETGPAQPLLLSGKATLVAGRHTLLAYLPDGGPVSLECETLPLELTAQWLDPRTGAATPASARAAGGIARLAFTAPSADDWVLILRGAPGKEPAPALHDESPFPR